MVLGAGVFYCAFSLAGFVTKITRNGFIKKSVAANYILDTVICLALCIGAFFLITFIFSTIPWLALLFVLGGIFEVVQDIRYLIDLGSTPAATDFEQCENIVV